jgi:hypothetical protein
MIPPSVRLLPLRGLLRTGLRAPSTHEGLDAARTATGAGDLGHCLHRVARRRLDWQSRGGWLAMARFRAEPEFINSFESEARNRPLYKTVNFAVFTY